jgi:hypothetical protein
VGETRVIGRDTHGRWPWIAAAAAPGATVALARGWGRGAALGERAMIASVPLLLWHQTEEWVLPGGFLEWFNVSVWGSEDAEFPVTPGIAFRINVVVGWGVSALAVAAGRRAPFLASAVLVSHAANAGLHVNRASVERRYNPGVATALVMGPLGVVGTAAIVASPEARRRGALLGVVAGLAVSAALPVVMRRRVARRR